MCPSLRELNRAHGDEVTLLCSHDPKMLEWTSQPLKTH
jgi:hypothetical protein